MSIPSAPTNALSSSATLLPSSQRRSVNTAVYEAVRRQLLHGEFAAGQLLGIEALAEALGTSTMPVREALRRLVAQQGLEALPNGTTRVPHLTAERLQDILRNRLLIEGTALEWAAPHLDAPALDTLAHHAQAIHAAQQHPNQVAQGLEHNLAFHFTIYRAARSPIQLALIESLWLQSGPCLRAARALLHGGVAAADHLHEHIVAALRSGDITRARHALEEDIYGAFDRLRRHAFSG